MVLNQPEVVALVDRLRGEGHAILLCFYTGAEAPEYLEPMLRVPEPPTGQPFDDDFADAYRSALQINPSIHDGAIVFGRQTDGVPYSVTGWSLRLLPPPSKSVAIPNRGSAFNSCLAMSTVPGVDRLLLISNGSLTAFEKGVPREA
jgi:hypothetical protein